MIKNVFYFVKNMQFLSNKISNSTISKTSGHNAVGLVNICWVSHMTLLYDNTSNQYTYFPAVEVVDCLDNGFLITHH